ncbi:MAG: ATP-binding cassette domain-containing protein [Thaumarchaeota archaeon]|nr:ATP-binding cassette domain-containing protein [Nitrososphaerota archaeon]
MQNADFAVDVQGLSKVYDGKVRALDGVDLKIEAGNVFALLGPNGAGKTTLMRILTTQIKPSSGKASVFGCDVVRGESSVRRLVSYVPQEIGVWTDITGYENLLIYSKLYAIPSDKRRKTIDEVLGIVGLWDVANSIVKTYSGGMIRRLELASAMLTSPKIMFLDEPTIGLDPSARKAVWERLWSFRKERGTTIFYNTHYMDEADQYSDMIGIINRGRVVTVGTAESLKDSIGKDMIVFSLQNHSAADIPMERITALDSVYGASVEGSELSVLVRDTESSLPSTVKVLFEAGVAIEKISVAKPTLDQVFASYAGPQAEKRDGVRQVRAVRRLIRRG